MKGSEKQVKWAEEIRDGKDFDAMLGHGRNAESNQIIEKAVSYVKNNDNASFWIDYRNSSAMNMLRGLMTEGLSIKGNQHDRLAKMAPDGIITITWREIVQDGKGGHYANRSKTL